MVTTITARIPRTWIIPSPDRVEREVAAEATTRRLLTFLLFCEIFLQRVGVPVGGTPIGIVLPVLFVVAALLVAHGDLVTNIGRTRAYLVAMAACCGASFLAFVRGETNTSVTSLLLLVVVYLPFCYGLAPERRARLFPQLLDRFVLMTSVLAGMALLQFGLQLVGWNYTDIVGDVVPGNLLMQGFNTSYPVQYGSELYKSNAFVCLEPSFASQFLAFGLVLSILRGGRWWRIPLFVLAILSTVSGTGVLLLGFAFVLLAVHKGARFTLTALAGVGLVVLILSFTPAGDVFAARATETSSDSSSGSVRFVEPYTRMYDNLRAAGPVDILAGNGPGWADRDAEQFFARTQLPLLYALVPKLLLEYGLVASVAFFVFLARAFVNGTPSFVLSGSVLIFYGVLSSNLLNPEVVYIGLLLLGWFTEDRHILAQPVPAARLGRVQPRWRLLADANRAGAR
jgi:hypothetical protein